MHNRIRGARPLVALLLAGLLSLALGACGSSSSSDATTLLRQTFSGPHAVNSGNLNFSLSLNPGGSSTLSGPITISFGGPFQSLGKGKLPASNFTITFTALGRTGSLGILSTGTAGYVSLQGTSYQLPSATFQRLETSFSQLAAYPGSSGSSGTLSKLGINPLRWLSNPSVLGNENVGGASTTHIRATINVLALLDDFNTFLQKASSLGISGAGKVSTSISAASRQRIAASVKNPTFDVWTGTGDKTVRRLTLGLTVPISGQFSSLLGGLRSAGIGLTMQYADLNQPQTIAAPTSVRPFTEFASKLQTILQAVRGVVGGSSSSSSGSGTGTGTTTTGGSTSTTNLQSYTQCIQAAANDVTKMQKCAALLNGGH